MRGSLRLSKGIIVPLQFVCVSGEQLHVPVLALHVAQGPLLGGGHPNGLSRGLGAGRLGSPDSERSLGERCAGSGAGAGTASSAGTVFGAFGLFFEPGGLPLRLGAGGSAGFGGLGSGGSARLSSGHGVLTGSGSVNLKPGCAGNPEEALQPQQPRALMGYPDPLISAICCT